MSAAVTAIDLMDTIFARWFHSDSWRAWRVVLKAVFCLPMDADELAIFRSATGRTAPPGKPVTMAWICAGRRGGKSLIAALVVVYLAFFRDYTPFTVAGETVTIMLVAADRKQARTVLRYVRAFIFKTPQLAALVLRDTREGIELSNGVVIEIHTASRVATRSYTLGGVVNDEIAFWPPADSAQPDQEILAAERPALATIPGALMLNISSPYSRSGALFEAFETYYGRDDSPVLFWKAPSRALPEHGAPVEMNSTLDLDIVREAYELDSAVASAEYGAEFRSDCERLFTLEMLDSITDFDRPDILPPDFEEAVA